MSKGKLSNYFKYTNLEYFVGQRDGAYRVVAVRPNPRKNQGILTLNHLDYQIELEYVGDEQK